MKCGGWPGAGARSFTGPSCASRIVNAAGAPTSRYGAAARTRTDQRPKGLPLAVGVGVIDAVAATLGFPLAVAAVRARRKALGGLHVDRVAAAGAPVGAG